MKNIDLKPIVAGTLLAFAFAGTLVAADAAVESAVESSPEILDAVKAVANFLPFPWNVVAASVVSAAGAIFVWKKTSKS